MQNNKFSDAINLLQELTYMSDMNNYLAVHTTAYLPKINKDGISYISSTAMAQDYEHIRSTVHIALNHIVMGHGSGDWSETPYIIMVPFNDLMKENGKPAEMSAVDTYFSVHPDKGLILPDNYRVIIPADDIPAGKLYEIRGNTTVYKHDNFTEDEEKQLVNQMSRINSDIYKKCKSGELADYEIEAELNSIGETGKKLYDKAKDKKAFLRGLFENKRNTMLSSEARNMAMQATSIQMGFQVIRNVQDYSETLNTVAKTAMANGISGNSSNKGHSNSMYHDLEGATAYIINLLYGNWVFETKGILNYTDNLKNLGQELISSNIPYKNIFIQSIINNTPLNLYDIFTSQFNNSKEWYALHDNKFNEYRTIADWDANTDETIRRYCDKQDKKFEQWRQKASKLPEYKKLINTLRTWQVQNIAKNTREY